MVLQEVKVVREVMDCLVQEVARGKRVSDSCNIILSFIIMLIIG